MFELARGQPNNVENDDKLVRSCSMPSEGSKNDSTSPCCERSQSIHRRSSVGATRWDFSSSFTKHSLSTSVANVPNYSIHPHSHLLHFMSPPELGTGALKNYGTARKVLSPSDALYQFCVAAVSSGEGTIFLTSPVWVSGYCFIQLQNSVARANTCWKSLYQITIVRICSLCAGAGKWFVSHFTGIFFACGAQGIRSTAHCLSPPSRQFSPPYKQYIGACRKG